MASAFAPVRFTRPFVPGSGRPLVPVGVPQIAFPLTPIPVANCPPEQAEGIAASAVAVAALPLVLLLIAGGISVTRRSPFASSPAYPLSAFRPFAFWGVNPNAEMTSLACAAVVELPVVYLSSLLVVLGA